MRIHSPAATKDDHEGVGRGRERARQGAQDEPHKRSVYTKFNSSTFFAYVGSLGISSEGYSGKGFVTHK